MQGNTSLNATQIVAVILSLVVFAATVFAPQIGDQWFRFITGGIAIIALGLHIPQIQSTITTVSTKLSAVFSRKQK